jgi:hypothetical protein
VNDAPVLHLVKLGLKPRDPNTGWSKAAAHMARRINHLHASRHSISTGENFALDSFRCITSTARKPFFSQVYSTFAGRHLSCLAVVLIRMAVLHQ